MIFVTGASGRLGSRIVNALVRNGDAKNVIAGVRDLEANADRFPEEVELRHIDYNDPETLSTAFAGVDRLVFIPSAAPKDLRIQQNDEVTAAAVAAGVKHVILVGIMDASFDSIHPFIQAYAATEKTLKESGMSWTMCRCALYIDNMHEQGRPWLETGEMVVCTGDGKINWVARDDIADAVVGVLAAPIDEHNHQTYLLTGPEALSYPEIADLFNDVLGTDIKVTQISFEEFKAVITKVWGVSYAGKGAEHIKEAGPLFLLLCKQGKMEGVTDHVEKLTGRPAQDMRSWLAANPLLCETPKL